MKKMLYQGPHLRVQVRSTTRREKVTAAIGWGLVLGLIVMIIRH